MRDIPISMSTDGSDETSYVSSRDSNQPGAGVDDIIWNVNYWTFNNQEEC